MDTDISKIILLLILDKHEYDEYVKSQNLTNKKKITRVFEYEENRKKRLGGDVVPTRVKYKKLVR